MQSRQSSPREGSAELEEDGRLVIISEDAVVDISWVAFRGCVGNISRKKRGRG